jgi:putative transposase
VCPWAALRELFADTRVQRCWWRKPANVPGTLPKSAHPGVVAAHSEIYNADEVDQLQVAIKAFEIDCGARCPKAVAVLTVLCTRESAPAR